MFQRKKRQQLVAQCDFCKQLVPIERLCQLRIDYDNSPHTFCVACPACATHVRIYKRCLTEDEITKIGSYAAVKDDALHRFKPPQGSVVE